MYRRSSDSPETPVQMNAPPDIDGEAQEPVERPDERSWWRKMVGS